MIHESIVELLAFARRFSFNAFLLPVIATTVLAPITFPSASTAVELPRIAAGFSHSVVIKNDGTLRAWGSNNAGQLGDGSNTNRNFPVSVSGLSGIVAVSAGAQHTVALLSNGTVWAWGANDLGQLGNGTTANSNVPVMVHGASGIVFIAAGLNHTVALRNDGSVIAWGDNSQGQLGAGGMKKALSPVSVSISGVAEVAVGDYHSYALKADGSAWVWGARMHGSSTAKNSFDLAPVPLSKWSDRLVREVKTIDVPGTGEKVYVISNLMHSVMLRSNGDVYTAGSGMGKLGGKSDFGSMSKVEWAGGVTADITPDSALFAGGKWRINGGQWHAGGDTVSGLSPDDYSIEFAETTEWAAPPLRIVSVTEGDIASVSGVYTFKTASSAGDATKTGNGTGSVSSTIGAGSSVSGTIKSAGGTDSYGFRAEARAKYVIRASGLKGAYVKVYSADGVILLAHSSGASLTWIAPSSGTFKIEIASSDVTVTGEFDLVVAWRPAVMDFNGDSASDIVFRNSSNGQTSVWMMNGASISSNGQTSVWMMNGASILSDGETSVSAGDLSGWQIKGFDDFNGDGMADILWRDKTSGQTSIWFMNGVTVIGSSDLTTLQVAPDSDLDIAGTGDFNGDGMADILWRDNTSGQTSIWFMNGFEVMNESAETSASAPVSTWGIAGIGDFDGDGKSDILWRHSGTGLTSIWFMDGVNVMDDSGLTSIYADGGASTWSIKAVGDFNGDGRSDILWRDSNSGYTYIWFMNGVDVMIESDYTSIHFGTDAPWKIKSTGDFNGDGKSDVMWSGDSGSISIWMMNGTEILAGSGQVNNTSATCPAFGDCVPVGNNGE